MKRYITLFTFILSYLFFNGQTISTAVVATSGDYSENQGYSLSWTLGETVSETFNKNDQQFTQGFQQAFLYKITDVTEPGLADDYPIEVYPNPAELFFNVKFDKGQKRPPLKLILFNASGSKVFETTIDPEIQEQKVNIHQFASNMFQMIITDEEQSFVRSFKVIKVNK